MDIYLQKGGQKHGPLSEDQIRRGIDAGVISSDDLACTSNDGSWHPLSEILQIDGHRPSSVPGRPHATKRFLSVPNVMSLPTKIFFGLLFALAGILWIVTLVLDARNAKQKAELQSTVQGTNSNLPQPLTWDTNGKPLFPPFTPVQQRSLSPVLPTPFGLKEPTPNATPINKPTAHLWSGENDFKTCDGEPGAVMHDGPVETDTFVYENDDWIVRIGFWKGLAQHITVARTDRTPMTDNDAQTALFNFAEYQHWSRAKDEDGKDKNVWGSGDAFALLESYHYKAGDGSEAESICFRIMTNEFLREYEKSNPSK